MLRGEGRAKEMAGHLRHELHLTMCYLRLFVV
jgi:hypothetical protein